MFRLVIKYHKIVFVKDSELVFANNSNDIEEEEKVASMAKVNPGNI